MNELGGFCGPGLVRLPVGSVELSEKCDTKDEGHVLSEV